MRSYAKTNEFIAEIIILLSKFLLLNIVIHSDKIDCRGTFLFMLRF